ncbi:hypothetical protein [Salidesulfovibrio onnuriiensis]|uniref:hypothetical protein n=1 Tax=Salidesulfovibrio onnuriiensis TaxID=2583823 RepID=UPI0011C8A8AE|nr:hypothetical protein [Salidesulfovibrio onnuriiensis]
MAKYWFHVVRGTQVFPLNPLREDLMPGDVFLVNQTSLAESNAAKDEGYLPQDHRVTRLDLGSREMSDPCFHDGVWQEYAAAFPSFSFSVDRGTGFNLNLPVDGIPVGLGFVQSEKVVVSMSISNATSFGLPVHDLNGALEDWCGKHKEYLAEQKLHSRQPVLLRVVSRVFRTRGVTASIMGVDSMGGKVAAGGDAFTETPSANMTEVLPEAIKSDDAAERFAQLAGQLGKVVPRNVPLPGGSATYMRGSKDSVVMRQTFDRPLAIGYIAFDVVVLDGGGISVPMGAQQNLDGLYDVNVGSRDKMDYYILRDYMKTMSLVSQYSIALDYESYLRGQELLGESYAGDLKKGLDLVQKKSGDEVATEALGDFWESVDEITTGDDFRLVTYTMMVARLRELCNRERNNAK